MDEKYVIAIAVVLIIACFVLGFVFIRDNDPKDLNEPTNILEKEQDNEVPQNTPEEEELLKSEFGKGKHHAQIVVKDYGTIDVELDADVAPISVANFADLVNKGFYNGLTFHRIMEGFMIQGGDPLGNGTGGSPREIKGEFKANGVENNISHKRGVISMARSQMPNSASSQFFIVHEDSEFLDGNYAGFGMVTSGMEVVDKICKDVKPIDGNGTVEKENQPIIEKITMID